MAETLGRIKKCERCRKFTRHQPTSLGDSCQECWNRIERGMALEAYRMEVRRVMNEALKCGMSLQDAMELTKLEVGEWK
jgi:hypothetical protein